jgi:hypothetical protein
MRSLFAVVNFKEFSPNICIEFLNTAADDTHCGFTHSLPYAHTGFYLQGYPFFSEKWIFNLLHLKGNGREQEKDNQ